MGHRGMYYTSQFSDTEDERDWNHTHPDPRFDLGHSSFENPGVTGVNTMGYFNVPRRLNDIPLGNFDSEIPHYRATNSRLPHGPYLHHSSAGNSTRVPSTYVQRVPPWHDHFATGTMSNTFIPQTEYGRASYKRKTPTYCANSDSGSSSSYYCVGSSSGVQSNAGSVHQFWPPTSMVPDYRSNDFLDRERSQRNVRRQYSGALRLEPNSSGLPPMSNHQRYILPTNVSEPTVTGERILAPASFDPHRTFSDVGNFSHETNRTPLGSGGLSSSGMRMYGGYHSNPISRSSPNTPLPAFNHPSARGTELGRAIHAQRTPYEAIPSYRPIEFTVVGRPGVESAAPLRYSRPLSIIGNSDETTGRGRNFYSRLQPFSDEGNSPDRWIPQGVAVTDWSAIFGPRDFSDHHRDMRLDIDDMSYEELLALEEMIGDVNTGLSEGTVGKYLTETTYNADLNQDDEEEKCMICLEEYEDCEDLARLNCGHDYHFSCIKKWLLIKNACPICKASVTEEE